MAIARLLGGDAARQFRAERAHPRARQRPAAVLLPILDHGDIGPGVLFTRRASHLAHHPGQISFPGGRQEPGEVDPVDTALREAREEVALDAETVEVLGLLDDYVTVTGFRVTPVVGVITPPVALVPDPSEVDTVFEVPLAFLMDPANHRHAVRDAGGARRPHFAIPYGEHYIWGATAGILMNLYEVLRAPPQTAATGAEPPVSEAG
ncbi:CoA pyrophosphatase [Roseospira visakhapatnamensis]|uniref:8-oxo-dGTP pyrophosphatase MutT (NUDIX family) n=1 Tax=Roseospira visakhapatnamensis TaxID=390880 RepID=A0A7W6RDP7_9PROT|nr:CoA pyrophosphatase [Roseospira visakhapatnamensis]MBB4266557.1 8-oxo-dGTP pyrophosphatase MutT (NUDIX family) [Roseospira visakhapatnamensis]